MALEQPQMQDQKRLSLGPQVLNPQFQSQVRFATNITPTPQQSQINTPPQNFQGKQFVQQFSQSGTPIPQSNKQMTPTTPTTPITPKTPIKQDVNQQQLINKIQQMGIDCNDQAYITDEERISFETQLRYTVLDALQRQENRKVKFN